MSMDIDRLVGAAQYLAVTSVARRVARATLEHAAIDGVDVPYFTRPAEAGAPTIVLVHGFGADKEGWLVLAGLLPRAWGLLVPDLPGFGGAGSIAKERA